MGLVDLDATRTARELSRLRENLRQAHLRGTQAEQHQLEQLAHAVHAGQITTADAHDAVTELRRQQQHRTAA